MASRSHGTLVVLAAGETNAAPSPESNHGDISHGGRADSNAGLQSGAEEIAPRVVWKGSEGGIDRSYPLSFFVPLRRLPVLLHYFFKAEECR